MRFHLLLAAALCAWLSMEVRAAACSCLPEDPNRSYENADHVVHVRVQGLLGRTARTLSYRAVLVEHAYKGCLAAGTRVIVETASDSAACGMNLRLGEYLLHGRVRDQGRAGLRLSVGSCDMNVRWRELTAFHREFLESRLVQCGEESSCGDGSQPISCFVDPCRVSQCDVEDAKCRSNYCGGCNAEWVDASGALVCQNREACDPDDPDRRYVAQSPTACQTVRFACEVGSTPFFDACGCGCERAQQGDCKRSGCSGQLCVEPDDNRVTTCEMRPEYACYQAATCERQADGTCGFTSTPELRACVDEAR